MSTNVKDFPNHVTDSLHARIFPEVSIVPGVQMDTTPLQVMEKPIAQLFVIQSVKMEVDAQVPINVIALE